MNSDTTKHSSGAWQTDDEALTYEIIGAAMKVHRALGPGFHEAIYHAALIRELMLRGIPFESQKEYEVVYEGRVCGVYRPDLVVDSRVITELKAASALAPDHKAKVVSYIKVSELPIGLLLNFGAASLQIRKYLLKNLKIQSFNPVNPQNPFPSSKDEEGVGYEEDVR